MTIATHANLEVVEFDQKKLDLVRNTFCKDATQEEFEVFVEVCKSTQLNPLFKQIYFIKRGGKPTHQTSIDGLRLIADRTKRYVPGREPTYTYDKQGKLASATSYVKKLAYDGSWHEVAASAMFVEYNAGQGQWGKMPHIMLAKCAEALALRRAFPADMLGLYTSEEMHQADVIVDPVKQPEYVSEIPISKDQFIQLIDLIGEAGDSGFAKEEDDVFAKNMCSHLNVESIDKIPQSKFDLAIKWTNKYKQSKVAQV